MRLSHQLGASVIYQEYYVDACTHSINRTGWCDITGDERDAIEKVQA